MTERGILKFSEELVELLEILLHYFDQDSAHFFIMNGRSFGENLEPSLLVLSDSKISIAGNAPTLKLQWLKAKKDYF